MSTITLAKINSEIVKAIPQFGGAGVDNRPVKGKELFDEVYANIFLCAKKKSGKTSTLFKILRSCVGRDTTLIVFCSTLNKDKNWISIRKYFEKMKGNTFIGYTSMNEDGQDRITELVTHLQNEAEEEQADDEEEEQPKPKSLINIDDEKDEEGKSKKPKKTKYLAPEYIIVCDDLAGELKSKPLVNLLKMNRHFKAKIIISSQYANDVLPEGLKQMDYFLLFKGHSNDKIEKIYKDADVSIQLPIFEKLYKYATREKFSFLYIDTRNDTFRVNFNKKFLLPENL